MKSRLVHKSPDFCVTLKEQRVLLAIDPAHYVVSACERRLAIRAGLLMIYEFFNEHEASLRRHGKLIYVLDVAECALLTHRKAK